MAKPDASANPKLKEAFDAYGFNVKWEDLFDMKMDRGCYCVIAWKSGPKGDQHIEMADFARAGQHYAWEVQNDGFNPISEKDWKKLRIVPECDWFIIPGNEDFQGL